MPHHTIMHRIMQGAERIFDPLDRAPNDWLYANSAENLLTGKFDQLVERATQRARDLASQGKTEQEISADIVLMLTEGGMSRDAAESRLAEILNSEASSSTSEGVQSVDSETGESLLSTPSGTELAGDPDILERDRLRSQSRSEIMSRGLESAGKNLVDLSNFGQEVAGRQFNRYSSLYPLLSLFTGEEQGAGFGNYLNRGGPSADSIRSLLGAAISDAQRGVGDFSLGDAFLSDPNSAAMAAMQPFLMGTSPQMEGRIANVLGDWLTQQMAKLPESPLPEDQSSVLGLIEQLMGLQSTIPLPPGVGTRQRIPQNHGGPVRTT